MTTSTACQYVKTIEIGLEHVTPTEGRAFDVITVGFRDKEPALAFPEHRVLAFLDSADTLTILKSLRNDIDKFIEVVS